MSTDRNSQRETTDALFARFQTDRDADALGEVFERTAPALLRRARRLVRDHRQAEDLLQDTFLVTLSATKGYDPERRCLPYLMGVLHWRATELRRRARIRQTRSIPSESLLDAQSDTLDHVAARELAATAVTAIGDLEQPYREVLELYLQAHLSPAEIAQRTDRAPGTVRVQLHRGLTQLRARLPLVLAALLPTLLPTRVNASTQPGPTPLGLSNPVRMRAVAAAVACGCLAILAAWWIGRGAAAQTVTPVATAQSTAKDASTHRTEPRPPSDSTLTGDAAPPRAEVVATSAEPATTVQVALTWSDTGAPALRVGARLLPEGLDEGLFAHRGQTDAEGTVRFDAVPFGSYVLEIDRGARHPLEVTEDAHVELRLDPGVSVSGIVVDDRGTPVPSASLWVSDRPRHVWSGSVVGETDADGHFSLRGLHPMSLVSAFAPGRAPAPLQTIGTESGRHLRFEVSREVGSLSGRVVDPAGRPIAAAVVLVGDAPRTETFLRGGRARLELTRSVRTDATGRFSVLDLSVGEQQVIVRDPHHVAASRFVVLEAQAETTLRVTLERARTVAGRVTDTDGNPIRGAAVRVAGDEPDTWVGVTTGADGLYEAPGVPLREASLTVSAQDFDSVRLALPGSGRADHLETVTTTLDVELDRVSRVRGQLLAAHEDHDWQVCLDRAVRTAGDPPPPCYAVRADGSFSGPMPAGGFELDQVLVAHATQPIWIEAPARRGGDGRIHLSVPDAFDTTGRLVIPLRCGAIADPSRARIVVSRGRWTYTLDTRLAEDGTLITQPLPVGRYSVTVDSPDGTFPTIAAGEVTIEADTTTRVASLDARAGVLRYRIRQGGRLPRQVAAWLRDASGTVIALRGFDGRQTLLPGEYTLSVLAAGCAPIAALPIRIQRGQECIEEVRLVAGARCELAFSLATPTAVRPVCEIRDAQQRPILATPRDVAANGRVTLPATLAPGRYELLVKSGAELLARKPFVVVAQTRDHVQRIGL